VVTKPDLYSSSYQGCSATESGLGIIEKSVVFECYKNLQSSWDATSWAWHEEKFQEIRNVT